MANSAPAGQGSFVSRTKANPRPNSYTAEYEVGASTTYEPTGSFRNTAFILEAGSVYTASLYEGGELDTGLVAGTVYPIALKKVVTGAGTVIKLLK